MRNRDELVTAVEQCWQDARDRIEGMDLSAPVYPEPLWTVRDVLVNCTFWNDAWTRALQAHLRGDVYVTETVMGSLAAGVDALNQRVVDDSRSLTDDEVRQRWIGSQDAFTETLRSLDAAAMTRDMTCPPFDERMPVPEMVRDALGHETGHINDVLAAVGAGSPVG